MLRIFCWSFREYLDYTVFKWLKKSLTAREEINDRYIISAAVTQWVHTPECDSLDQLDICQISQLLFLAVFVTKKACMEAIYRTASPQRLVFEFNYASAFHVLIIIIEND